MEGQYPSLVKSGGSGESWESARIANSTCSLNAVTSGGIGSPVSRFLLSNRGTPISWSRLRPSRKTSIAVRLSPSSLGGRDSPPSINLNKLRPRRFDDVSSAQNAIRDNRLEPAISEFPVCA
jgi:hypothetical protein